MRREIIAFLLMMFLAGETLALSYNDDFNTLNVKFWTVTTSGGGKAEVQNGDLYLSGVSNTKASAEVDSIPIEVGRGTIIEFKLKTDFQGASASGGSSREFGLYNNGTRVAVFLANEKGFRLITPVQNLTLNKTLAQEYSDYKFIVNDSSVSVFLNGNKVFTVPIGYRNVEVRFKVNTWSNPASPHNAQIWVDSFSVVQKARVLFDIEDALTGKKLENTSVNIDGKNYVVSSGEYLYLYTGVHNISVTLNNYRPYTATLNITGDTAIQIELYPSSAVMSFEEFPAEIETYKNTIYTLTFTLSPIDTSATYNTYLSISGLPVIEVTKEGSIISPEGGKYYLGDITGPTKISIKFKPSEIGQYRFFMTLESQDILGQHHYKETKQGVYNAKPLPFDVQMPTMWVLGKNTVKISDNSGGNYLLTVVMKDSAGNTIYMNSFQFGAYTSKSFSVNINKIGKYSLELTWNGQTAVFNINVNPSIILKTKELNVTKGGEGTILLEFKNTGDEVQYYTIKLSGGFLETPLNKSVAIAPHTTKDVPVTFAVPDDLQYDAYELNATVSQGNITVFSGNVVVNVHDPGFLMLAGGGGGRIWLILAGLGIFVLMLVLARR